MTDPPVNRAGWYPDPGSSAMLRWYDGESWTDNVQAAPGAPEATSPVTSDDELSAPVATASAVPPEERARTTTTLGGKSPHIGIGTVLIVIAAILYFTGSLDKPLSNVGLNRNPCVQNAFGATFCGDDAKELCKQIGGPACEKLGYDTTGSAVEQLDEAQQQLEDSMNDINTTEDYGSSDSDGDGADDDLDSSPYDPTTQ